jgi:YhcH/YjgK/YiaL family protein
MIFDILSEATKYSIVHPTFGKAFDFLMAPGGASLPDGRYEIEGDRLFALVSRKQGLSRVSAILEAHRRYIDIHYVFSGTDSIGWRPLLACRHVSREYDPSADVVLFQDEPVSWAAVLPGCFAVFFPEDAHAPLVSQDLLHKVVLKVQIAE